MRLIDVDAFLKELEEWNADLYDTSSDRQLGVTDAIVIACQMPTVDAIPVEWIRNWIELSDVWDDIDDMLDDWAEQRGKKNEVHSDI